MSKIEGKGIFLEDVAVALKEIITDWNLIMTKLDADDLAASNYAAVCALTANAAASAGLTVSQQDIIDVLDDAVTKINACCDKLTADTVKLPFSYGSYAAHKLTDVVNPAAYVANAIKGDGMNQGDMVLLLYNIKTSINAILAHLDTEAGGAGGNANIDTDYAATYPISFDIDATGC